MTIMTKEARLLYCSGWVDGYNVAKQLSDSEPLYQERYREYRGLLEGREPEPSPDLLAAVLAACEEAEQDHELNRQEGKPNAFPFPVVSTAALRFLLGCQRNT